MFLDYETLRLNGAIFSKILYLVLGGIFFNFLLNKIRCDPYFAKWSEQFPGPRPLPWFGNSLALRISGIKRANKLLSYEKIYGPLYRLWFSSKNLVIVIADVKYLEIVYSSSKVSNKPVFLDHAKDFWGDSLFSADRSVWKKTRGELQPMFVKNNVNRKIPRFNQIINKYVGRLEVLANGEEFEIGKILTSLIFDMIFGVFFDITAMKYSDEDIISLYHAMKDLIFVYEEKLYRPWLRSPIREFFSYCGRIKECSRLRDHFFEKVLERNKTSKTTTSKSDDENSSFLQILFRIKTQCNLDENYVHGEFFNVSDAVRTKNVGL